MSNFINKWAKKAIDEYTQNNDIETLQNEHFCLCFQQGEQMIKEMDKVELASKYKDLEEEEKQEMLLEKIQEKIDSLIL